PKDTRRQNIMVTIPGPLLDGRPNQQELVLNDVVEVPLKYAREVLGGKWGSDWALGYALTVHSPSQTPKKSGSSMILFSDQILPKGPYQEWKPARAGGIPPEERSGEAVRLAEQQLRKVIQRKLVAYKRQDQAKGLRLIIS
ncbi:MAG: hypothetical protein AB2556_16130, partial [Candidatus Thiodiazotropha sp.]